MSNEFTGFKTYNDYINNPIVVLTLGLSAITGYIVDSLYFANSNALNSLNYLSCAVSVIIVFTFISKWTDSWKTISGLMIVFGVNLLVAPYIQLSAENFAAFYFRNSIFFWVLIPTSGLLWSLRASLACALLFLLQYISILYLTSNVYLTESFVTVLFVLAIFTYVTYAIIHSMQSSIIHQKGLISKLESKTEKLNNANKTKTKMLSIISHDLRSPLMSLINLSFLMRDQIEDTSSEELKENFQIMDQMIISTNHMVENLVDWSKSQIYTLKVDPKQVEVELVAKSVFELVSAAAKDKNVTLNSGPFETKSVFADPNSLQTILRNLTTNALKFTDTGGIIKIYSEKDSKNIKIIVEDNGIGMNKEQIEDLLDPDKFRSSSGTKSESGTGLGFNICIDLMKQHNGKLSIDSEPEKGTKVILHFPRVDQTNESYATSE